MRDKIPLACLPSDFGGELDTITNMHEKHCKEFSKLRDYFIEEEKQWNTNFNNNNVIDVADNFSKLDID